MFKVVTLNFAPPPRLALCHWVRSWRQTGYRRHRVCIHPDSAGVHPARLHQESGRKLGREALPGAVLRGGGVLVGGGRGWKAWPREQKVRSQSNQQTTHTQYFLTVPFYVKFTLYNCFIVAIKCAKCLLEYPTLKLSCTKAAYDVDAP